MKKPLFGVSYFFRFPWLCAQLSDGVMARKIYHHLLPDTTHLNANRLRPFQHVWRTAMHDKINNETAPPKAPRASAAGRQTAKTKKQGKGGAGEA
jgi:hypothetical protein